MAKNGECDAIEEQEKMLTELKSKTHTGTMYHNTWYDKRGAIPATEPVYNPYGLW